MNIPGPAQILICATAISAAPAKNVQEHGLLLRRLYVEGERASYLMKGENDRSTYQVRITSITKQGSDGRYFEEFAFSDLVSNGKPRPLPVSSQEFRLAVRLEEGDAPFSPPDLSQVPASSWLCIRVFCIARATHSVSPVLERVRGPTALTFC